MPNFPAHDSDFPSWTLPELSFYEVTDPRAEFNLKLEALLKRWCDRRQNIAFLVTNDGTQFQRFLGVSRDHGDVTTRFALNDSTSTYRGVSTVRKQVAKFANHIGLVEAVHSKYSVDLSIKGSSVPSHSGMLVLSTPFTEDAIQRELSMGELRLSECERKSSENVESYMSQQQITVRRLKDGLKLGHWYVATYFFASNKKSFEVLQSELSYASTSPPAPLKDLLRFALPTMMCDQTDALRIYKYLLDRTSTELAALACSYCFDID